MDETSEPEDKSRRPARISSLGYVSRGLVLVKPGDLLPQRGYSAQGAYDFGLLALPLMQGSLRAICSLGCLDAKAQQRDVLILDSNQQLQDWTVDRLTL